VKWLYPFVVIILIIWACKKDPSTEPTTPFKATPYEFPSISNFRTAEIDTANLLTNEGVNLGHLLFFDTRLSKDFTQSCSSCHVPEHGFSDSRQFSIGVNGTIGRRQAMSLLNLAWSKQFFWDGRAATLREQALFPVADPTEMHLPWDEAVERFQNHPVYKEKFKAAFGTEIITKELITKALEQYMKALVVYNSPFDKYTRKEISLSEAELRGYQIFNSEKGDCFHCHSTPELMVHPSKTFSNNGLDLVDNVDGFKDNGLGAFTKNPNDNGNFKIPSLRNLDMTAPYMHDGRFTTLDEVIDFYNGGPKMSPSLDPIMITEANRRLLQFGRWGLGLTEQEKSDLKAFLLSFSDSTYLKDPLYLAPKGI
jgi:cytochrome c peroxidase